MAGESGPPPGMPQLPPELFEIDDGPRLIRILTPVTVVATFIVFLRVALRLTRRVGVGLDDWLIFLALIFTWATYVVAVLFVKLGGLGRPLLVNLAIDPNRLTINQKLLFSGEIIYPTAIAVTKYSILAMYWRIFPTRTVKIGSFILGGMTTAWWLAVCLVAVFQCTPQGKVFNAMMEGHCIDNNDFFLGNSIPNIITDAAILCLPTYEIWNLHLPRSQRVALGVVFLLGAGVVAASAVRLHFHIVLAKQGSQADFTAIMFEPVLWTVLEPDMAIICASLPALRPMLTTFMNSKLLTPIRSYFSSQGSHNHSSGRGGGFDANATIGGTPFKKIPGSSNGASTLGKRGMSSNVTSSRLSSQEKLNNGDPEIGLWPEGYANERNLKVTGNIKSGSAHGTDEIPLEAIGVRTVVDWQESTTGRQ